MSCAHPDTLFRFALTLCIHDPRSALSAMQRHWLLERLRLQDGQGNARPLSAAERTKITPALLTWADHVCPRVGATLRRGLGVALTDAQQHLLTTF